MLAKDSMYIGYKGDFPFMYSFLHIKYIYLKNTNKCYPYLDLVPAPKERIDLINLTIFEQITLIYIYNNYFEFYKEFFNEIIPDNNLKITYDLFLLLEKCTILKDKKNIIYNKLIKCSSVLHDFESRIQMLNLIFYTTFKKSLLVKNDEKKVKYLFNMKHLNPNNDYFFVLSNINFIISKDNLNACPNNDLVHKYLKSKKIIMDQRYTQETLDNLNYHLELATFKKNYLNTIRAIFNVYYLKNITKLNVKNIFDILKKQKLISTMPPENTTILKQIRQIIKCYLDSFNVTKFIQPTFDRNFTRIQNQTAEAINLITTNYKKFSLLLSLLERHGLKPDKNPTKVNQLDTQHLNSYTPNQLLYKCLFDLFQDNNKKIKNPILNFLYNFDMYYKSLRKYEATLYPKDQKLQYDETNVSEESNLFLQFVEYIDYISTYTNFLFSVIFINWEDYWIKKFIKDDIFVSTYCDFLLNIVQNYTYSIIPEDSQKLNFIITPKQDNLNNLKLYIVYFDWNQQNIKEIYDIIIKDMGYKTVKSFRNNLITILNILDERAKSEARILLYHLDNTV